VLRAYCDFRLALLRLPSDDFAALLEVTRTLLALDAARHDKADRLHAGTMLYCSSTPEDFLKPDLFIPTGPLGCLVHAGARGLGMVMIRVSHERLPPLDVALVLETTGMEVFRDQFGMNQCRERGIGARRRKLGKLPAEPPQTDDTGERMRDGARALLAAMCDTCPFKGCRMKEW
jgi:hypothetical protein